MRIPVLSSQSTKVVFNGGVPLTVKMRALESTPVFWSQDRASLDGNVDASGVPGGGIPMTNLDPTETLTRFLGEIWVRSPVDTKMTIETYTEVAVPVAIAPPSEARKSVGRSYPVHTGPLPGYDDNLLGGRPR
jgi:hypothetical protein